MIQTFVAEEARETETMVSVITFGEKVTLHTPLTKAAQIKKWNPMKAKGPTLMGEAIKMAKDMIEDKNTFPSPVYRPMVILVSDGRPDDNWNASLEEFINGRRTSKCDRIAMAIGNDADVGVLECLDSGYGVFIADDA